MKSLRFHNNTGKEQEMDANFKINANFIDVITDIGRKVRITHQSVDAIINRNGTAEVLLRSGVLYVTTADYDALLTELDKRFGEDL